MTHHYKVHGTVQGFGPMTFVFAGPPSALAHEILKRRVTPTLIVNLSPAIHAERTRRGMEVRRGLIGRGKP